MKQNYPDWATEKQKEGMAKFTAIADEYWVFDIEFRQDDHGDEDDESRFYADITWGEGTPLGVRKYEFDIAFDYEATWNRHHERIHEWQFLFSGGEATREVSTEVLALDLFFYLDGIVKT